MYQFDRFYCIFRNSIFCVVEFKQSEQRGTLESGNRIRELQQQIDDEQRRRNDLQERFFTYHLFCYIVEILS